MEVQVADAGPCRKTISIRIPPEKVRAHVESMYSNASHQVRIKGFRPGKVPRKVLEKKYGEAILSEAKESLINDCFQTAMREHKVAIVGQPRVEGLDASPLDPEHGLEFQIHCDVRPEVSIGDVSGIEITTRSTEVTDADVDDGLQQLAASKRAMRAVDEPAGDGDFVKVDAVYRCDGAEVQRRGGLRLTPSIAMAGTDPETFAAKLRGAGKGDQRAMEITFPDTFEVEAVRGKQGEVEFTVAEVQRIMAPSIDDAFAKEFDFESLDAMKAELRTRIGDEKTRAEKVRQEDQCIEALIAQHPFDLPESMVADEAKGLLAGLESRLEQSGVSEDEARQKLAEAEGEARQEAEKRVRVFFILDAVARKEKLFVTEGEIEEALRNIAASNEVTVDQAREHMEKRGQMAELRFGLLERKVREHLRAKAKIADS